MSLSSCLFIVTFLSTHSFIVFFYCSIFESLGVATFQFLRVCGIFCSGLHCACSTFYFEGFLSCDHQGGSLVTYGV